MSAIWFATPSIERINQQMENTACSNVLFAETLGSFAANLLLDSSKEYAVGQEINANHLRGVRSGEVTGIAKIVHRGRTSQVWEIKIYDEKEKLSCISRLTMAVIPAF
jgi:1,4-dihydroxy-2-naphthoyl-CoA hydrolase